MILLVLSSLLGSGWGIGEQERRRTFTDSLARLVSSDLRKTDVRLVELDEELEKLPEVRRAQQSPRLGFHSQTLLNQDRPDWIQIDLGAIYSIDRIVVVPAVVISPLLTEDGYAFPLRFKVEVGSEEDLSDATVIVDETKENFPNPGRFPLAFKQAGVEARYVRVTSTRLWPALEGYIWALGEIMVLSGDRNVALNRKTTASSSLELPSTWSARGVNDGHSILGLPVTREPSPTNGYMGKNANRTDAEKWVMVDLGAEYPIDSVRLIPARPPDFADAAGIGFPKRLSILLSNDPKFAGEVQRANGSSGPLRPWGNPQSFRVSGGKRTRYVKVVAHELWSGGKFRNFALAELQAYAGDENVALGKRVTASDVFEVGEESRWAPGFLVDGFSSQHKLVEWPEYLDLLKMRAKLEREQQKLLGRRDLKARQVAGKTIVAGSSLTVLTLLALGTVIIRQKSLRKRDAMQLREQIARDLHDDLGSNLGSISLLSELGSRLTELPDETRTDFLEIHDTAERSAEAMRDIVWLIDSGSSTLSDLIAKMREAAARILGDVVTLEVVPEEIRDRELPLLYRRHVLFAFKEALNNVRKHAAAARVQVRIAVEAGTLGFVVSDNGVGFRIDERVGMGHGLKNLKRRAERLSGTCEIESQIDQGTTIRFTAPLNKKIHAGRNGKGNAGLVG